MRTITFKRRYTKDEWERLKTFCRDNGYQSISDMIRKKAIKLISESEICAECGALKVQKFNKNLGIVLPDSTAEKLMKIANEKGIAPSELIARVITDPLMHQH